MTNTSGTNDKPSAGDPIPPKCSVIEVHVGELKQLFNAIDPSPFRDKDLDPKAEALYMATTTDGTQLSPCINLFIELPLEQLPRSDQAMLQWFVSRRACNALPEVICPTRMLGLGAAGAYIRRQGGMLWSL